MAQARARQYSVPAVDKAFAILELLSETPDGLRLTEICSNLDIAKSSVYVLLDSLERHGYVDKASDGAYRLTLRMYHVGARVLSRQDIRRVALPHMRALRDRTGFPVHLAALENGDVIYLEKVDGPGFVKFDTYVGKRAAWHLTAVGKALVAHLPPERLDALIAGKTPSGGTEKAVSSLAALHEQLRLTRETGYAIDDEEEVLGVRCIGAPIRDHTGGVVASLSIIGLHRELPATRFPEFGQMVIEMAGRIATELGYNPERNPDHHAPPAISRTAAPPADERPL